MRGNPFWGARVAIVHRSLWLVPAFLPLLWPAGESHWVVVLIVALGLSDLLGNVSNAPWLSWMADLLPAERAGRFWGGRQRFMSGSVFVAAISYGWILDTASHRSAGLLGFTVVFALAAVFGVGDILVHLGVVEPPHSRSAPGISLGRRLLTPWRDRDFRRLTLAMGAWTAALALPGYYNGVPGFFNVVYLHEVLRRDLLPALVLPYPLSARPSGRSFGRASSVIASIFSAFAWWRCPLSPSAPSSRSCGSSSPRRRSMCRSSAKCRNRSSS